MAVNVPFAPAYGKGVTVSPAIASAATAVGLGNKNLFLTNTGANICYVRVGIVGAVATAADMPIAAGAQVCLSKFQDNTHVAYISAAGTTLNIMPGEGYIR
jgi:hypothetical protein